MLAGLDLVLAIDVIDENHMRLDGFFDLEVIERRPEDHAD